MTTERLRELHTRATTARDAAHKAYTIALRKRTVDGSTQGPGDSDKAWQTLLRTNEVRDMIYDDLIKATANRVTTADTPEEFAAIAHIRGWCHNSTECPICKAQRANPPAPVRPTVPRVSSRWNGIPIDKIPPRH